jgi:TonB family protein
MERTAPRLESTPRVATMLAMLSKRGLGRHRSSWSRYMKDVMRSSLVRSTIANLALLVMLVSSPTLRAQQRGDPLSSAVDAKGVRHRGSNYVGPAPWIDDAIKTVAPNYPYEARSRRIQGSGLFRLSLDLNTGSVRKVTLIQSTGSSVLDNSATDAFRRWRWKPGRWQEIDMPITFTMSPRLKGGTYIGSRPVSP